MKSNEQIAESYLNGNISWCREQLHKRNGRRLQVEVEDLLRDWKPGELATFRRLMEAR